MERRQFITSIGGATAWAFAAQAQQRERKPHIAVLMGGFVSGDPDGQAEVAAFEKGLKALGRIPDGNIELDYHWPGVKLNSIDGGANSIAASHPDLVVARSTPATAALINSGFPIVFILVADPIGSGFVQSLAKPGGNLTGFATLEPSIGGKLIEFLKEAAPSVSRVALLFNPQTAPFSEGYLTSARTAAQPLGVTVIPAPCYSAADIEAAITARAQENGGGIICVVDTFLTSHRDLIIELAARHRLPAIFGNRTFVPRGALMAYAVDFPDLWRRGAEYVDRILKGGKPADLPVQLPIRYQLAINLCRRT